MRIRDFCKKKYFTCKNPLHFSIKTVMMFCIGILAKYICFPDRITRGNMVKI